MDEDEDGVIGVLVILYIHVGLRFTIENVSAVGFKGKNDRQNIDIAR